MVDSGLWILDSPASTAMFVGQSDGLSVGQHVAAAMLDVDADGGLRTLDPPVSAEMFVGQSDGLSVGQHVAAAMLDVDCISQPTSD